MASLNLSNHPMFIPVQMCAATLRAESIWVSQENIDFLRLAGAARHDHLIYSSQSGTIFEDYRTLSKELNGACGIASDMEKRLSMLQITLKDILKSLGSLSERAPDDKQKLLQHESNFLNDYLESLFRDLNNTLSLNRLNEKRTRITLNAVCSFLAILILNIIKTESFRSSISLHNAIAKSILSLLGTLEALQPLAEGTALR